MLPVLNQEVAEVRGLSRLAATMVLHTAVSLLGQPQRGLAQQNPPVTAKSPKGARREDRCHLSSLTHLGPIHGVSKTKFCKHLTCGGCHCCFLITMLIAIIPSYCISLT